MEDRRKSPRVSEEKEIQARLSIVSEDEAQSINVSIRDYSSGGFLAICPKHELRVGMKVVLDASGLKRIDKNDLEANVIWVIDGDSGQRAGCEFANMLGVSYL